MIIIIVIIYGRRLSVATGDVRETTFLVSEIISVVIQHYNSIHISEYFGDHDLQLDL